MSTSMCARAFLIAALLCVFSLASPLSAQKSSTAPANPDEVVRVKTELIQSPVIVLDKQGNFVDGLSREQFELNVDGRPRSLSFFEPIVAGSAGEIEKQKAARQVTSVVEKSSGSQSFHGRTVIFFIDDFHLNSESVNRTRTAVLNYLENSLGQNDRALIYNAGRGADGKSAPDVAVQLRVLRDDKVLSTSPLIKVPTEGIEDLTRIPYAGELALRLLPPGRYLLSVTATSGGSKMSHTQSVKFVVE